MARILRYLLSEDLASDAEDLADKLRKAFGVSYKEIRQMYKDAGQKTEPFYQMLSQKAAELEAQVDDSDGIGDEMPSFKVANKDTEQLDPSMAAEPADNQFKDEGVIDVLKYLSNLWRSRDRVRVIAARLGIDPDIYAAAGLGNIPDDYDDEDIWNTMDQSNHGQVEFYQSKWQPYYIDTMERLKELPDDIKQEISDIVQKSKEHKRDVSFPVRSDRPYDDEGQAFEGRLLNDLVIEEENSITVLSKGSSVFKVI